MPITIIFKDKKNCKHWSVWTNLLLEMSIIALIFIGNTIVRLNKFLFFCWKFSICTNVQYVCTNNFKEIFFRLNRENITEKLNWNWLGRNEGDWTGVDWWEIEIKENLNWTTVGKKWNWTTVGKKLNWNGLERNKGETELGLIGDK